ncbi:peptide deformylase [Reichenbachiella agarivorans]|uniref:Peptide deformylase n=1 Tax=Reichenbachiella agarivorans TaxID=2979464 RepID=A0ABY6CRU1_9BACT|nr:peptide deformylase [Reichenbachiella agarivorans]UXP33236.1 peptide deformylase [Reichenbachiella agarivorans]
MIYPIVVYGDAVLKKAAVDIEEGSIDVKQLAEDMFETMHHASGIGLAAPQIGKSIRMFVVDGSPLEDEDMADFKKIFINPEILWEDGDSWTFTEGCLSIPGIREDVTRPSRLKINYLDENFVEHEEEFDGMRARIIQHEYDHIEGILFTDYLTPFKKRILKGKLANITKGKCDADYKIKLPKKR